MSTEHGVADYYDRNTRRFLRWGHGRKGQVIHRAVWGPRVTTRPQAMHYCHDLLLAEIMTREVGLLVDLGCGVGGSLAYLADRTSAAMKGVTLSRLQAQLGTTLLKEQGLADRVAITQGSYTDRDLLSAVVGSRTQKQVVFFAIESLVHAQVPEAFFGAVSSVASRGDLLIICDDFLTDEEARQNRMISDFREGWRTGPLLSTTGCDRAAKTHGFSLVSRVDLSGYLELDRPRDKLVRVLVGITEGLPRRSAYWGNLVGGNALQSALSTGLLRYEFVVMERQ